MPPWAQRLATLVRQLQGALGGRRAVGGSIDGATGAMLRGIGFSSTRTGTGTYTITFDTALADHPSPTFGLFANGFAMTIQCNTTSPADFTVTTYRSDTGAAKDCSFSFWLLG